DDPVHSSDALYIEVHEVQVISQARGDKKIAKCVAELGLKVKESMLLGSDFIMDTEKYRLRRWNIETG
ncbi:hypothetical protein HAX54_015255, partial [Datura stramonium]|nr:hypothetical protein [Datura stramonium]